LDSPSISSPEADANNDGITNLQAYASNVSPWIQAASALPVVSLEGGYLTVSFTRRVNPTDVTYTVAVSADLGTWNSGAGYTTDLPSIPINPATERAVIRDNVPVTTPPERRFMRVTVSQ